MEQQGSTTDATSGRDSPGPGRRDRATVREAADVLAGRSTRGRFRRLWPVLGPAVLVLWVLMEVVAMATDLAEFLGAALGFNLLFGIPLWLAGLLTGIA